MKVLLTGAAGFAGSHIADEIVNFTDWNIVALDCLTYAGHISNLSLVPKERLQFVYHDFRKPLSMANLTTIGEVDYIIHNGAETHVKNSFYNPQLFFDSNVVGTMNMLDAARVLKPKVFLYTSTDEVFGQSSGSQGFKEGDGLNPSNPYSASKAAGEMMVHAYAKSYQLPAIITRTMNMFGIRQHVEKFIPMTIANIKKDLPVDIHTNASGEVGSRQWLHASDQASAILYLLNNGKVGETYHISGERHSNVEVVNEIAKRLKKQPVINYVNAYNEFPGHDLHYCLNDDKIRDMGWSPSLSFREGLDLTV